MLIVECYCLEYTYCKNIYEVLICIRCILLVHFVKLILLHNDIINNDNVVI